MFCVTAAKLTFRMSAELNIWHLDDGTWGGTANDLLRDLQTVRREGADIGLVLNELK